MGILTVNRSELKSIAEEVQAERIDEAIREKDRERQEKEDQKSKANQEADRIIDSIPDELKKAAKKAKHCKEGLMIVAKVPIVEEEMTRITDSRGYLSSDSELILRAVRKKLKSVSIQGVEIRLISEMHTNSFGSADGQYYANRPCKYYYIEAKIII